MIASETTYSLKLNVPRPHVPFKLICLTIEDDKGTILYKHDITNYTSQHKAVFASTLKPFKCVYCVLDSLEGRCCATHQVALLL